MPVDIGRLPLYNEEKHMRGNPQMKIGVCASPDNLALLAELGYDYPDSGIVPGTAFEDCRTIGAALFAV